MKNSGKASQMAVKLIVWSFLLFVALVAAGYLAAIIGAVIARMAIVLFALWGVLAVGLYFYFRDPDPVVPMKEGVFVAPAHGKIETVEENATTEWLEGTFKKVTIKLHLLNIPVQYAPAAGEVSQHHYRPGEWRGGSADDGRESLRIEFLSGEVAGEKYGLRLEAGRFGRRIVSWIALGEEVERGQRIGVMQWGSRCEVFLPASCDIKVRAEETIKGGETVLAERPRTQPEAA